MTNRIKILFDWAQFNREKYKHYNNKTMAKNIDLSKFDVSKVKTITEIFPELKPLVTDAKDFIYKKNTLNNGKRIHTVHDVYSCVMFQPFEISLNGKSMFIGDNEQLDFILNLIKNKANIQVDDSVLQNPNDFIYNEKVNRNMAIYDTCSTYLTIDPKLYVFDDKYTFNDICITIKNNVVEFFINYTHNNIKYTTIIPVYYELFIKLIAILADREDKARGIIKSYLHSRKIDYYTFLLLLLFDINGSDSVHQ